MPGGARRHQASGAPYYHVMNRGHNREAVFRDQADFTHFLGLLGRYRQRCPVRLYHYCLLNNHFHLLVACDQVAVLSRWMAGLLRSYVYYFHRRYGFVGHLWQGRFKSPAVAAEEYFLSCARYIERNPVEAGIVVEPWAYRWSSCAPYALGTKDTLLHYNVWYGGLAEDAPGRQQRWREFLLGDDPHEEAIGRSDWAKGGDDFRRRLYVPEARPARRRGRPRKPPPGQEGYFPQFYEST